MVTRTGIEVAALTLVCVAVTGGAWAALSWTFSVISDLALVGGFFAALIAGHA